MYKIYFNLAIRNLIKHFQNTMIMLLGLLLGLASALFIYLFYQLETNFDDFHQANIYRVINKHTFSGEKRATAQSNYPQAPTFKEKIPQIEEALRVTNPTSQIFFLEGKRYTKNMIIADANFFDLLGFELAEGNPNKILLDRNEIVITKRLAQELFPKENPIGKRIQMNLDEAENYTISGIAENPPVNSHLDFDIILANAYVTSNPNYYKEWNGGITYNVYLKLSSAQAEGDVIQQMNQVLAEAYPHEDWKVKADLQAIQDIHRAEGLEYEAGTARTTESLYMILCVGGIILALSLLNFVVLYTAQKDEEIHALSLMRIFGAHRKDVWKSSILEVGLIVFIAEIGAILVLLTFLPFLNEQLLTKVSLNGHWAEVILFFLVLGLFLSLLLSSLSLRGILKSALSQSLNGQSSIFNAKNGKEKLMLVLQFSLVFVLSIYGLLVYQQHQYLLHSDLGFDAQKTFCFDHSQKRSEQEMFTFKEEALKITGVEDITLTYQTVGLGLTMNGYRLNQEEKHEMINVLYTDTDFLESMGIELVVGENFSRNRTVSKTQFIVNEAFATLNGWKKQGENTIYRNGINYKVIGIVKDFAFGSVANGAQPVILSMNLEKEGASYNWINVRYNSANPMETAQKVQTLWKEMYPQDQIYDFKFLDEAIQANYESVKGQQQAGFFFGSIALIVAISGLWGITRFSVLKRTKEMSIRRVNGASRWQVLTLFNTDYLKWISLSFLIALPVAHYFGMQWLSSFTHRIQVNYLNWGLLGLGITMLAICTITLICWKTVNANPSKILRDL